MLKDFSSHNVNCGAFCFVLFLLSLCGIESLRGKNKQNNQSTCDHDPKTIDVISLVSLLMDRRRGCIMHCKHNALSLLVGWKFFRDKQVSGGEPYT